MSRSSFKDFERALKAPFWTRWGFGPNEGVVDAAASNGYSQRAATATDNEDIMVWGTDSDNALKIGDEAVVPMKTTETFYLNTLSGTPNQVIMLAMFPCTVTGVSCKFATANGATLTAQVVKDSGVQSVAGGNTIMSNSFNLNGTANTTQNATLADYFSPGSPAATASTNPSRDKIVLAAGDRLSLKFSGAVTSLAGLAITIAYRPGAKGHVAYYRMSANGSIATQYFHLANRPMTIKAVSMMWGTAGSDAGAVTVTVTKDVSTNAPGGGTAILNAAQSVKGAANTVVNPALTATAATLQMAAGDRLSMKTAGNLTSLANLVVAVWFQPIAGRKEVIFNINANGSQATQPFFVADIDYEIVDLSEVHATLGTDGGSVNIAVSVDGGGVLTTAPGGGLVAQTDNTNAGFNAKGTINTVQVGTLATLRNRIVPAGAYISALYAGATTALAGVCIAVSLRPRG